MKKQFWVCLILLCVTVLVVCLIRKPDQKINVNGTSELSGVSMLVTQQTYKPDTTKITVVWKNDSDKTYLFGVPFTLEKKENENWEKIGGDVLFPLAGIKLKPNTIREHTYNISLYTNKMDKGTYRIVANIVDNGPEDSVAYRLTAEFTVN